MSRETVIGSIIGVDFSGDKVVVSVEVDRKGPWQRSVCALVLLDQREPAGASCEICGGIHDNDALTDICTSCEARINEEGSP